MIQVQRYAKCCAFVVAVLFITSLYLSTTAGLNYFQFSGSKAVQWAPTAVGLDTNASSVASVPVNSSQPPNVSVESNGTAVTEDSSRASHRTTVAGECRMTPQAGIVLPNNTLYLVSPCQTPDPYPAIPQSAAKKQKVILVYNRPEWFHADDPSYKEVLNKCGLSHACKLTDDRSVLQEAAAVLVHVPRLNDPVPYPPTMTRSARQIWIAYGMESPVHYEGKHDSPAWKGVFNWTLTYRTDSDIFHPYGYLTLRSDSRSSKNYTSVASKKSKPVAWFVSNCNTPSQRGDYVRQLSRYIDVDTYGACGSFVCSINIEDECVRLLNTTYHFYLSFENSFCKDYVTEKLFKIYNRVDVIPVVRGAAFYDQYFPPNTFINTAHFQSPKDLAARLKRLIADTEAYAQMLKTKDRFVKHNTVWNVGFKICRALHDPQLTEEVKEQTISSVRGAGIQLQADVNFLHPVIGLVLDGFSIGVSWAMSHGGAHPSPCQTTADILL